MAAMMKGDTSMVNIEFNDVTPFNLGTDIGEDDVFVMIGQNTPIPTEKVKSFATYEDN